MNRRSAWDHPRSRGENTPSRHASRLICGSSPLTRGKQAGRTDIPDRDGLISAHAGKMQHRKPGTTPTRAHPRSRRENSTFSTPVGSMSGSSPLTQGKHRYAFGDAEHPRLIPAHAGKTPCGASRRAGTPAHPRSREENDYSKSVAALTAGSSPLTRGKLRRCRPLHEGLRLIPAHTGKTSPAKCSTPSTRGHPRAHEETTTRIARAFSTSGSSPLTEGKLLGCDRDCGQLRLTPEHAGKTLI